MSAVEHELPILDAEIVDLDELLEQPLQHPPATRAQVSCRCGKGSVQAHGPFSCDEVLAIAGRVESGRPEPAWRPYVLPVAAGLAVIAVAALVVWGVVLGVTALVAAVTAWISTYWPLALVVLLFLGGGAAKCAGLHCGGCRG